MREDSKSKLFEIEVALGYVIVRKNVIKPIRFSVKYLEIKTHQGP